MIISFKIYCSIKNKKKLRLTNILTFNPEWGIEF